MAFGFLALAKYLPWWVDSVLYVVGDGVGNRLIGDVFGGEVGLG